MDHQPSAWRCNQCGETYLTESSASRCEMRHQQIAERAAAYQHALAEGKPLLARLREQEGRLVVSAIFFVGKRVEEHRSSYGQATDEENTRHLLMDADLSFTDFLPNADGKHHRYLSVTEAVSAGWCPFFSQHYQTRWPLAIREQITDAFLALPDEVQCQNLLARQVLTRHSSEEV